MPKDRSKTKRSPETGVGRGGSLNSCLLLGVVSLVAAMDTSAGAAVIIITNLAGYHEEDYTPYHHGIGGQYQSDSRVDGIFFQKTAEIETPHTFATTTGSANIATGQLKASIYTDSDGRLNDSFGYTEVALIEDVYASGTGTVTATMNYHGGWILSPTHADLLGYQANGRLILGRGFASDWDTFRFDQLSSDAGQSVQGELEVSYGVSGYTQLSLAAELLTQISYGIGAMDFSNTATLVLTASPGVTLTYGDERFLSTPAVPTVPLPASLPLALFSCLALFVWRRPRRRSSRALAGEASFSVARVRDGANPMPKGSIKTEGPPAHLLRYLMGVRGANVVWRVMVAAMLLIAGPAGAGAAPVTTDYENDLPGYAPGGLQAIQSPALEFAGITVTGSGDISAVERLGLGIVDGVAPFYVDRNEWIRFTFNDGPATNVSYYIPVAGSTDGGLLTGERLLEGFGPDGALLGVVSQAFGGTFAISSLFGDAPIANFILRSAGVDEFRVGSVTYTPAGDTSVVPLPLAGPMLLVALGWLFGITQRWRRPLTWSASLSPVGVAGGRVRECVG